MIVSNELPSAAIQVVDELVHVGYTEFDLYGVADVELHLFVETEGVRVKRLLWVQFEGFREDNNRTYNYGSDPVVQMPEREIHVNARFYPKAGFGGRANSDGDHALRLLRDRGYGLGEDLARVRLVWLLNEPARDELMLIYLEDLTDSGLTVERLQQEEEVWQRFSQDLQERAFASFKIEETLASSRGREDVKRR